MEKHKAYVVVDGEQVFTAHFAFQQQQATGRRIDRIKAITICAVLLTMLSIVLTAVLLIVH